jgi:Tol biopolymer transport system component
VVRGRRLAALLCGVGLLTAACSGSEEEPPEGTILFAAAVGKADKYDDLYAVDVRTGKRRNLTRTTHRGELLPSASPDRTRLAFYASAPEELLVLDLRTGRRTRLAAGADLAPDVPAHPPSWSPDGSRVAFGVTTGCDPFEECGRAEVWVVSAAGGRPGRLSRDGRAPSWSPDGRRLAWWDNIGLEGYGSRAMVWDADTGRRRIVGRSGSPPAWLPDGTLVAGGRVLDLVSGRSRRARPADHGSRSGDGSHVAFADSASTGVLHVRRVGGGGFQFPNVSSHAWSREGRRLALFELAYGEQGPGALLSVVNADGGGRRALRREHRNFQPSGPLVWAAENLLVYGGHLPGQDTELLAVAPGGGRREPLTGNDTSEFEPAASPDGGRIAFVRDAGYHQEIWSMRRDGSAAQHLAGAPERRAFSPAWSPDGDELAFVRSGSRTEADEESAPDLFAMRSDGSAVRRLTRNAWATDPAWSPGGERIAYTRTQLGSCQAIWLMAPNGDEDERLTDCDLYAVAPAWSPNGGELAFLGRPRRELDFGRFLHLYVIDWEGGDPRLVTREVQMLEPAGRADDEPRYDAPSWSPDGSQLVYSRKKLFRSLGLYVVDADGGRPVRIARGGRDPFWAERLTP